MASKKTKDPKNKPNPKPSNSIISRRVPYSELEIPPRYVLDGPKVRPPITREEKMIYDQEMWPKDSLSFATFRDWLITLILALPWISTLGDWVCGLLYRNSDPPRPKQKDMEAWSVPLEDRRRARYYEMGLTCVLLREKPCLLKVWKMVLSSKASRDAVPVDALKHMVSLMNEMYPNDVPLSLRLRV